MGQDVLILFQTFQELVSLLNGRESKVVRHTQSLVIPILGCLKELLRVFAGCVLGGLLLFLDLNLFVGKRLRQRKGVRRIDTEGERVGSTFFKSDLSPSSESRGIGGGVRLTSLSHLARMVRHAFFDFGFVQVAQWPHRSPLLTRRNFSVLFNSTASDEVDAPSEDRFLLLCARSRAIFVTA